MKIPQYDQQVQTRAAPQVRQSSAGADLDAFGAARARAAEGVAKGLQNVGEFFQERDDIRVADEITKAEAELQTRVNLWQADAAKTRRGDRAAGLTQEADDWLRQQRDDIGARLTDPRVRRAFDRLADRTAPGLFGFARSHENRESLISLKTNTEANTDAAIDAALLDPSPANIDARIQQIRRNEATLASAEGAASPEVINQRALAQSTKLHTAVIGKLVSNEDPNFDGPAAAQAYLNERLEKGEVDPEVVDRLKDTIEIGTRLRFVQVTTAEIMAKRLPENEALAYARSKFKGENLAELEQSLSNRYAQDRRMEKQAEADRDESAMKKFLLDGVMPSRTEMANMSANGIQALRAAQQERATGTPKRTNMKVYTQIRDQLAEDPVAFFNKHTNLYGDFYPHLDDQDMTWLLNARDSYRKGDGKALQRISTLEQQVNGSLGNMPEVKKGPAKKFIYAQLEAMGAGQKAGWQPSWEDVEGVVNRALVREDSWFGSRYWFEVPEEERGGVKFKMTAQDTVRIDKQLRDMGDPNVTPDEIEREYRWELFPETQPKSTAPADVRPVIEQVLRDNRLPVTERNIERQWAIYQQNKKAK